MLELEAEAMADLSDLHDTNQQSARNLLHYLALRRHDIRQLQERLASLGLSSLGGAESHVKNSIDAILRILYRLANRGDQMPSEIEPAKGFAEGEVLLEAHTESLLGPKPSHRHVRIMVTMPSEAARDYELVRVLLANGMDLMRINCAHDTSDDWALMVAHLRHAMKELGRDCRILMDLAGSKPRTGPIEGSFQVVKWRPRRNSFGVVTAPARVWLTPIGNAAPPPSPADAILPVPGDWLGSLSTGDRIKFFDTRGSSRSMKAVEAVGASWWAESAQTAYVAPGIILQVSRARKSKMAHIPRGEARVGELPAEDRSIVLRGGDSLILTKAQLPGRPTVYDGRGHLLSPARIAVTFPEIFSDVRAGESVWLDDGKIGGVIKSVGEDEISAEITHARAKGESLKADKGINFPDSELRLPALTTKDIDDLAFITKNADLVGYSFVKSAEDIHEFQSQLAKLSAQHLGVVLKIETRRAFDQLPELILAAMRCPRVGVMIARGDLAVECGYERMAEVQEEILWIAEAAHLPVIWATQVLEQLAKKGSPSRAEITDAAMSERAECVMLNKGPYIVEAVRALDDILDRMQDHQSKKRSMLRHLRLADQFTDPT